MAVFSFDEPPRLLSARTRTRPAETWMARCAPGDRIEVPGDPAADVTALVLAGSPAGPFASGPGDLLFGTAGEVGALAAGPGGSLLVLLDVAESPARGAPPGGVCRVGRNELVGAGFTGITGIRAVHRGRAACGLRLGPPPGARWVLVGVRCLAVFSGKLTLFDGEEPHEVRAGCLGVAGDPSATLFVEAGNDSAFAIGLASPDVTVALG